MADTDDGNNNNIFPLINRQTPVIDRLRNRNSSNNESETLASDLGNVVSKTVISEDKEELTKKKMQTEEQFRNALAASLGVEPSQIKDSFVNQIGNLFGGLTEQDILTDNALRQLGLLGGSEGKESETDKGDGESSEKLFPKSDSEGEEQSDT